jgi:hypothetical protein
LVNVWFSAYLGTSKASVKWGQLQLHYGDELHDLAHVPAMIGAVRDNVKEHLFPGHRANVTISEIERD